MSRYVYLLQGEEQRRNALIFGPFPLAPLCLSVRPSHLTRPFIVAYNATASAGKCTKHDHGLHACKVIVRYVWWCWKKEKWTKTIQAGTTCDNCPMQVPMKRIRTKVWMVKNGK
jgi:hypothetical protein